MKKTILALAVAATFATPLVASANGIIVLDFEGVGDFAAINDFYNGGTDSCGNTGIDYDVSFGANALAVVDLDAGGTGNIANEPTPNTALFFLSGSAILNYAAGFADGFSFYYSAARAAAVNVYDGLNGTGNLLGTISLPVNFNNDCTGDPSGNYCNWSIGSLAFAGIGRSIDFTGTANFVAFDNVTFGSTDPNVIPEPGTLALLGLALSGLGFVARRRRA